jgi:hypothetical protein
MDIDDEPKRRPIEASLAQALAWGAPMWILDQDGPPPPTKDSEPRRPRLMRRIYRWFRRER